MKKRGIQIRDEEGCEIYPNPFPVGAIYMSVDSRNPSQIFGGTWEQIKDKFLLCAGSTYKPGTTGGEASVTLNSNQMPAHNHTISTNASFTVANNQGSGISGIPSGASSWGNLGNAHWFLIGAENSGGNQPHNNMPPYLAVYVWRRIA